MRAFGGKGRLANWTKGETRKGLQCVAAIHPIPPE
jgi:hypothetical protein